MASYFDVKPPSSKGPAKLGDQEELEKAFGKQSLFSPQVTSILDDLEREHQSSSSEDAESNSEESDQSEYRGRKGNKEEEPLRKAKSSPLPAGSKKPAPPPQRPGAGKSPHLARFHSLRSMLFQSNIEDKMAQEREQREKNAAEAKWREDYDKRQGLNRPKTPPSPKGSPSKEGFRSKMHSTLRRITSKDAPPMMQTLEEDDRESTASDDDINVRNFEGGKKWDEKLVSDDESIHHSDVEDLVRWVSRRDPPSDGEARKRAFPKTSEKKDSLGAEDSGNESLGHDDIPALVRHVSRRPPQLGDEPARLPSDYADESTASDSEADTKDKHSSEDEDTEELMRWVSRKEGDRAGPIKKSADSKQPKKSNLGISDGTDSEPAELTRWTTRKDDTSGESDMEAVKSIQARKHGAQTTSNTLQVPGQESEQNALTHDDVDELVRWVSRKNDSAQNEAAEAQRDDEILKWKEEEDAEKKKEIGMKGQTEHTGSLAADDVDELVQWVSHRQ